jgi:hypothetical protein
MMAIEIKMRFDSNDGDLFISADFKGSNRVASKIHELEIFSNVLIFNENPNTIKRILDFSPFGKVHEKIRNDYSKVYICISNVSGDLETVSVSKQQGNAKIIGFIEGYSSYLVDLDTEWKGLSVRHKIYNEINSKIFHEQYINKFDFYIAFYKSLFPKQPAWPVLEMQNIDVQKDTELRTNMFKAFDYEYVEIKQKYIFMEECFSEDLGNNNDIQIVEHISNIVGKENIIIKRHPRNKENRFAKLGYFTMEQQSVPWEIFALDSRNNNHILISFSSGAALNYNFLTTSSMKSILIYRVFRDTHFHDIDSDLGNWLNSFAKIYCKNVLIPENVDQLQNLLSTL